MAQTEGIVRATSPVHWYTSAGMHKWGPNAVHSWAWMGTLTHSRVPKISKYASEQPSPLPRNGFTGCRSGSVHGIFSNNRGEFEYVQGCLAILKGHVWSYLKVCAWAVLTIPTLTHLSSSHPGGKEGHITRDISWANILMNHNHFAMKSTMAFSLHWRHHERKVNYILPFFS